MSATQANNNQSATEKKPFLEWFASLPVLRFFLNSNSTLALVGKIVLMVPVIPYAYIWICAVLFELVFHWMRSATFVLFSAIGLAVIGITLSTFAVIIAVKKSKKAGKNK